MGSDKLLKNNLLKRYKIDTKNYVKFMLKIGVKKWLILYYNYYIYF
jgi:hypothetical protein